MPGRDPIEPCKWLAERGEDWCAQIRWATLDLSGPYRKESNTMVPDATKVADPFHLVKLANEKLDEVRRRVQNETLGHRGHKHDPLYRCRRLFTKADERLDDRGRTRLLEHTDPDLALEWVERLGHDLQVESCPPEINQLGRTLIRWRDQIAAWHHAQVTNAATEGMNNLIKRVKRVAFGFTRFRNYRIRSLLHAGRPNWDLLATLTPR